MHHGFIAHMKFVGFETMSLLIRLPFRGDTFGVAGPDGADCGGGERGGILS